jgi:hypothetical protein
MIAIELQQPASANVIAPTDVGSTGAENIIKPAISNSKIRSATLKYQCTDTFF